MTGEAAAIHLRRGWPAGFLSLATLILWIASKGKWSDALIDSGREWIVPDALARGELLYRDVVYWFGPFTPYFHSLFFRLFGSGFATLVLAGAIASAGILGALYLALRRVTGRTEAFLWTALAIPALVFMPHAGGSLLGMGYRIWHAAAFALLAVYAATRPRSAPILAGTLGAMAALCRLEWGLATLAAVALALALREGAGPRFWKEAGAAVSAFLLVSGIVIGGFILAAGREAVLEEGHLLLTRLPPETRAFLLGFSGVRDWRRGLMELLYSFTMWLAAALLVELIASGRSGTSVRRRLRTLGLLLPALAVLALLGGASGAVLFSAAPLMGLVALAAGLRRPGRPRSAALAAYGLLALVLSYRRPFHIGDSAYVGPPLLFAFVSAAGLLRLRVAALGAGVTRRRLRAGFVAATGGLLLLAFAGRFAHYRSWEGEPIPGTGGFLGARPGLAREITELASRIRRETSEGESLVVFPEGELLNHLSGRSNPIRHRLYLPGYLSRQNEERVLDELSRARPAAIVIWRRPTSEYGPGFFGEDYGTRVGQWIERTYRLRPFAPAGAPPRRNPTFLYGRLRE